MFTLLVIQMAVTIKIDLWLKWLINHMVSTDSRFDTIRMKFPTVHYMRAIESHVVPHWQLRIDQALRPTRALWKP